MCHCKMSGMAKWKEKEIAELSNMIEKKKKKKYVDILRGIVFKNDYISVELMAVRLI
jgi:methionine salvage enolase-phosphatase E1